MATLREIFDYQKYSKNEELRGIICEAENRYRVELDDSELDSVNAAGNPGIYSMPLPLDHKRDS